jgi:hypothetical protein
MRGICSGLPARGSDLGLRVLDRTGSPAERDAESLEAAFELEAGKLEDLGRFPEIDPFIEVIADHSGFEKLSVITSARGACGESTQEPVVEGIQKDDSLLSSACHDGELSLMHPRQDLSGPLG